ncbi:MAG: type III PLP-dependent enzyme [candidate division Zixibacteria bacterium]|nr:type III PLP-dependent enzyme [candidate division Zixibacteria bacterium]
MTHSMSLSVLERRQLSRRVDAGLLRELLSDQSFQTPTMFLSQSEIGSNYRSLKAALPRVHIHYAVKPNNHPLLIDEVVRQGGNFDVCSAGEIDTILKTGINPAGLIHSHPIKSAWEFDQAVARGVEVFVVDNQEEVRKLARYRDKRLKILVRFRIGTIRHAVVNLQYKFGCTAGEVLPLARQVEQSGHEFYGLCFHVGSQCIYPENYVKAIQTSHELIHALETAGLNVRVLDIGGGFPVAYVEPVPAIDNFCAPIAQALDRDIRPGIRVVSEPGRFIAATSVTLICSVVGKALRDGKIWYYLDDGLYSTFSGIVYDHCQYPVVTAKEGAGRLSVLAGPTCDSFDVMYDGLMIPEHEVGDRMAFMATGAYCAVSGSGFNALRRAEYTVVE